MIFIPGNVPSSKNSQQIVAIGKPCRCCGRRPKPILVASKTTARWRKNSDKCWQRYRARWLTMIDGLDLPLHVTFTFKRDSARKFDLINACQVVQDAMVKYGWLSDDNATVLVPYFGESVIDRDNPGVLIHINETQDFNW